MTTSYVRATVSVGKHKAAAFGGTTDLLRQAEQFATSVRNQLPAADAEDVSLLELAIFDSLTTADSDTITPHTTCVAGAAAGDVTISGILATDELVSVWQVTNIATDAGPPITTDLTAEFAVTDADTINNTGGTDSTGDILVVSYFTRTVLPA